MKVGASYYPEVIAVNELKQVQGWSVTCTVETAVLRVE
jgi:hypothetical protein